MSRSTTEVRGVIEMGTPKNGKGRTVGTPAFLTDELSTYLATIPSDGLLFPDEYGGPLRGTNWSGECSIPRRRPLASLPRRGGFTICDTPPRR